MARRGRGWPEGRQPRLIRAARLMQGGAVHRTDDRDARGATLGLWLLYHWGSGSHTFPSPRDPGTDAGQATRSRDRCCKRTATGKGGPVGCRIAARRHRLPSTGARTHRTHEATDDADGPLRLRPNAAAASGIHRLVLEPSGGDPDRFASGADRPRFSGPCPEERRPRRRGAGRGACRGDPMALVDGGDAPDDGLGRRRHVGPGGRPPRCRSSGSMTPLSCVCNVRAPRRGESGTRAAIRSARQRNNHKAGACDGAHLLSHGRFGSPPRAVRRLFLRQDPF